MRVGANARQYSQIKRWLKEGMPQHVIARQLRMEPQSLERIVAHLEGREERNLALEENPTMARIAEENARLKAKLEETEEDDDED
jgi:DNA-binding transcriptional MerR regulator